jgi:membrane protein DedA with SNARE-associated domain
MIDVLGVVTATPTPKPLPGVFNHFAGTLRHWGYLAVGFSLFVENIGVPLPGQLVLIAAALYAPSGQLNIYGVVAVAIGASVLGSAVGYAIGEYGGRPLAERYGKYVFLTPKRLQRVEKFFAERGTIVVLLGRFVDGVRQACALIAGLSDMTFKHFMAATTAGAVLWVGVWAIVGETAGDHITTISKYTGYVAAALAVAVVLFIAQHVIRVRRHRAAATSEEF